MTSIDNIIREFKEELLGFVSKHIADKETAKDIHQEILIKIFTHYRSLKHQDSLKSWMYQIARNGITDYYRRRKIPRAEISETLAEPQDMEDTKEDELLPCIRPFLQGLRPNYKQALEYIELENHSQKELAEKLDMSYSGAKSTVQRARQQLREIFDQCCQIEVDRYGSVLSVTPRNPCDCS